VSEPIDEIQDQIEEWEGQLDGEEFEQTLLAKFESLRPGEPGRAELLCSLAERRLSRGNFTGAQEWFEQAVNETGDVIIDPRCGLLASLLAQERHDDVLALEGELRRVSAAGEWRGGFHEHLGETFEAAGQPERALRWFNTGVRDLDLMLDEPTTSELLCLHGRDRVRRQLGRPQDSLDVYLEDYRRNWQAPHD
jgi:tetratricopeptide (TPR) repeat protein